MTASVPQVLASRSHGRLLRDPATERALAAQLNVHQFRRWRLDSLRWAVAASLPFWLHCHWPIVPGVVRWLAGLVEATAFVLATGYAVLEHVWAVRAERMRTQRAGVVLHVPWTARHQVRSALWCALAIVSAVPWTAAVIDRPLPDPVLWRLAAAALLIGALLAVSTRSPRADGPGVREPLDAGAIRNRYGSRAVLVLLCGLSLAGVLAAGSWTLNALDAIARAESDRDGWQRPADVLQALNLTEDAVVADFGSGVGYFALKLSDRVGEGGQVLAVDVRALPLLLLRARAFVRPRGNVSALHADAAAAELPAGGVDAVLIANTYHELEDPRAALAHAFQALRPGGRLVVVDPSEAVADPSQPPTAHHHASSASALNRLRDEGFEIVRHEERFIDTPGQSWWLIVARKPVLTRMGGRS